MKGKIEYRHCGVCHEKTINVIRCDKCLEQARRMRKEINKRLSSKTN